MSRKFPSTRFLLNSIMAPLYLFPCWAIISIYSTEFRQGHLRYVPSKILALSMSGRSWRMRFKIIEVNFALQTYHLSKTFQLSSFSIGDKIYCCLNLSTFNKCLCFLPREAKIPLKWCIPWLCFLLPPNNGSSWCCDGVNIFMPCVARHMGIQVFPLACTFLKEISRHALYVHKI